jgi:hypothetical protein
MKPPLHGAFRRRCRYWLRVVTRRRVVDDHCRLPGHVRLQATQECTHLARRRACSRPHGGDGIERRHGIADQIKCTLHLAVPQAPTDVPHSIGEEGAVLPVSVRHVGPAFDCLGDMLDAHRKMEPVEHATGRADARRLPQ